MFRLFVIAFALALLAGASAVFAQEKPDLEGHDVVGRGPCNFFGNRGYCFIVKKGDVKFIAQHDATGRQSHIYLLKKEPEGPIIHEEDVQIVWSRDSV